VVVQVQDAFDKCVEGMGPLVVFFEEVVAWWPCYFTWRLNMATIFGG